ncbi:MAG TPA: hypothetical protein VK828_03990 [Terriglobales bacterium]|jgi:hypothetical protein|nr:hypothetical protein [Terriglobales bacterium]
MKIFVLLVVAGSLLLVRVAAAQEPTGPSRGPDRGTEFRVHGIQVLPATGRPFVAMDNIEWTRQLEDGSTATTHLFATVARDSQGRIYREHRAFVPADKNQQSRRKDFVLLDPIGHTRTTCTPAKRHCTVSDYHESASFVLPPDGLLAKGTRYLSRESLGSNVISGLNVVGTRETLSITVGVVGNSQPLVATKEYWYSPDLQVNLSVTRKDPRIGVQVLQLVDLSRSEPDPTIFQVPSGFVVEDTRSPVAAEKTPSAP